MFGVHLLKLTVELLGMSGCDEELGCTCGVFRLQGEHRYAARPAS
jgi:hypothetical protein